MPNTKPKRRTRKRRTGTTAERMMPALEMMCRLATSSAGDDNKDHTKQISKDVPRYLAFLYEVLLRRWMDRVNHCLPVPIRGGRTKRRLHLHMVRLVAMNDRFGRVFPQHLRDETLNVAEAVSSAMCNARSEEQHAHAVGEMPEL